MPEYFILSYEASLCPSTMYDEVHTNMNRVPSPFQDSNDNIQPEEVN